MRCDGSPDPSVQPEINSFISLWREDSETQVQRVLENCALALQVRPTLWICFFHSLFKSVMPVYILVLGVNGAQLFLLDS